VARPDQLRLGVHRQQKEQDDQCTLQGGLVHLPQGPTMSFLTTIISLYAIGAGITTTAGTKLALQWILVKEFRLERERKRKNLFGFSQTFVNNINEVIKHFLIQQLTLITIRHKEQA